MLAAAMLSLNFVVRGLLGVPVAGSASLFLCGALFAGALARFRRTVAVQV